MNPLARRTVAFVGVVLLLAVPAAAQTVVGTVRDISGAVIPAASITAVTSDGKSVAVTSDDAGRFDTGVAAVRLTVKSEGFEEATIQVSGAGAINVILRPLNFADSVVVTATRGAERLPSAASATVITSAELSTMAAGALDDALR